MLRPGPSNKSTTGRFPTVPTESPTHNLIEKARPLLPLPSTLRGLRRVKLSREAGLSGLMNDN